MPGICLRQAATLSANPCQMLTATILWPCRCMRPSWQTLGLQQRSWASGLSSPTPRQHQQGWWLVHDCQQPCSRLQPHSRMGIPMLSCCHVALPTCSLAAKSASSWSVISVDILPFPEQLHLWKHVPDLNKFMVPPSTPSQQTPHHPCLGVNTLMLTANSGVQQQL